MKRKVKITVRSGGLNGFTKYGTPDAAHDHMKVRAGIKLGEAKAKGQDKQVSEKLLSEPFTLVTQSALKGIVSRLMGETLAVREIDSRLGGDADRDEAVASAAFEVVMLPKAALYSERYRSILAPSPTADLSGVSISSCKGATGLFGPQIAAALGTGDAQEAFSRIYEKKEESAIQGAEARLGELERSFKVLAARSGHKLYSMLSGKIEAARGQVDVGVASIAVPELVINEESIAVLEAVSAYCLANPDVDAKLAAIRGGAIIPKTQKDWSEEKSYSTRGVGHCLYLDFNVFVTLSEKAYRRFLSGPMVASWGEGGVVEWEDADEFEMPLKTLPALDWSFETKEIVGLEAVRVEKGETEYFEYAFASSRPVTPYSAHALATTILGKGDAAKKGSVSFSGSEIRIRASERLLGLKAKIRLVYGQGEMSTDYALVLEKKASVSLKKKDRLSISVAMSYAENSRGRLSCPVRPGVVDQEQLGRYLERFGFRLVSVGEAAPMPPCVKGRFEIHNLFVIKAEVEVEKPAVAMTAFICGVGMKKSYGFGQLNFEKVEKRGGKAA